MELINTTPHPVVLHTPTGTLRLPAAATPARVTDAPGHLDIEAGLPVPVRRRRFGATVTDLPQPRPGVGYIVSRAVAATAGDRGDLYVPGPLVPGPVDGEPGCTELHRFAPSRR